MTRQPERPAAPVEDIPPRRTSARLWTVEDVSEYLGVPVRTLYQWRTHGYGPPARRVGRYLRYRQDEVVAWFDAITTQSA